jgi:hypothetical protein
VPHIINTDTNGAVYTYFDGADHNILAVDGADPRAGQNKGQKGWAIADIMTFTDINWFGGDHTVKLGVKYKDVDLTAQDSVPGRPVFYYDVTPAGVATDPWKSALAVPVAGFASSVTSNDKQLGVFAQDDWVVNDHLTLNLGLRWDIEWNESYLDIATPQFLIDSLNTEISPGLTYGQSLGLSSDPNTALDINNYISTGNNREPYTNAFQPRLGISYDLGGDQQHVIFGGAGRAYDRTLYDYLQLEQTKFALATSELRFNTTDHPCAPSASCVAWDPVYAQDPNAIVSLFNGMAGEVDLINNDLSVPYSDQFSLGMRNRIADWNTSVAVTRIESKDGFVFTLGNRYPNGDFWQNRSQPWGNSPPGLAGVLLVGNSGIETNSTQLLLSADKPFTADSKWGATFSYTYTDADQNQRHQRALLLRRCLDQGIPFHPVECGVQAPCRCHRNVCGTLGTDLRRQAHLVDAPAPQPHRLSRGPRTSRKRCAMRGRGLCRRHERRLPVARSADHQGLRGTRCRLVLPARRHAERHQRGKPGRLSRHRRT